MPTERSPKASIPEQQTQESLTPEEIKNQEKVVEQAKADEKIASNFNPENRKTFERMPEQAKNIANQVYEGLYKTPGINKIVGKLEIAYNQLWIDKHQEKAAKLKEKIDGFDLRINALNQSEKEIKLAIEDLKQQNIPGVESLQIKIQDIERQKEELLNKKDRVQSKFEERENKLKLYVNERDLVADRFITHYEEKLEPLESELKKLQNYRNQLDLLAVVTEAKYKEQSAKLDNLRKKKVQIENTLHHAGMSEKEIRKNEAIKQFEKIILENQKKIRSDYSLEKEKLARSKAEINKKIAKVDAKANPYRDKREEFVRIKERRPIKMEVAPRQKEEFKGEEKIKAHPRIEVRPVEARPVEVRPVEKSISNKSGAEKEPKNKEKLPISDLLHYWNNFLREVYKNEAMLIDEKDFLRDFLQLINLPKDSKLDFEDFKDVLGKYLKSRKLSKKQFKQSIDKFFEKKIKSKK